MHFTLFAILFTLHHPMAGQSLPGDSLANHHFVNCDNTRAKYWAKKINCAEESAKVCDDSISLLCEHDIYYRNKVDGRAMKLTFSPKPKRSPLSICLDLSFGYLYSPGDSLYILEGDTLSRFPGSQFCGVDAKILNKLSPSDLIGMSCTSWGAVIRNKLILPTGHTKRIFPGPETAIAHWKDSSGEYLLGDHRTKAKLSTPTIHTLQKHSNSSHSHFLPEIKITKQDKPQTHASEPLLYFSKECHVKPHLYRHTAYYFPSDTSKIGRSGCFFWGKKSTKIYCPRPDGLDSFPRSPDTFSQAPTSIQGCDF